MRKASCVGCHLSRYFCPLPHYVAAGEVAALAEERMCTKYTSLPATPSFTPVAMETSGAIGPESLELLKELGRRVRRHTGDEQAVSYLLQRIFVIQRGNAASFLGGLNGNTHTHIYIYIYIYIYHSSYIIKYFS